jgi:NADPH:quinone reductase-like Zn-dependent oxidoreductase
MRAAILENVNMPLRVAQMPDPVPGEGEVVVQVSHAALNHRDVWITKGQYAGIKTPVVLGSDACGTLDDGTEVIINPGFDFGEDERFQSAGFSVLGMPGNGTLAEKVVVPAGYVYPKPAHLTSEQAAALPLAGLTAYRALFTRGGFKPGERVLVTGIGGGVALFAMQFALSCRSEVWVTSSSADKIQKAEAMGAAGGVNYRQPDWTKEFTSRKIGFDVIIDGAGGPDFGQLLHVCNPGARISVYGGTAGKFGPISPQILFWKQISIVGSTMGSQRDFVNMLNLVNEKRIIPVVSRVFDLEQAQEAFDYMDRGMQFGKPVVKIG